MPITLVRFQTPELFSGRRGTGNKSYRVDETEIDVKGKDRYFYRAVDSAGQTIEFLLTAKRDAAGAKRFFRKLRTHLPG